MGRRGVDRGVEELCLRSINPGNLTVHASILIMVLRKVLCGTIVIVRATSHTAFVRMKVGKGAASDAQQAR